MSDQILFILVYAQYTKNLVYELLNGFFHYTNGMWNTRGYKKWLEMTIFKWYVDGMWCHGVWLMTFFLLWINAFYLNSLFLWLGSWMIKLEILQWTSHCMIVWWQIFELWINVCIWHRLFPFLTRNMSLYLW